MMRIVCLLFSLFLVSCYSSEVGFFEKSNKLEFTCRINRINGNKCCIQFYEYTDSKSGQILYGKSRKFSQDRYGKLDGKYVTYWDNGNIHFIKTYHNGAQRGKVLNYHKNGQLAVTYSQDTFIYGKYIIHNEQGVVIESGKYGGRGNFYKYVGSNLVPDTSKECVTYSSCKTGKWRTFYSSGKLKNEGYYFPGVFCTTDTFRERIDSSFEEVTVVKHGVPIRDSLWTYYDSLTGQITKTELYRKGILVK